MIGELGPSLPEIAWERAKWKHGASFNTSSCRKTNIVIGAFAALQHCRRNP
jgi:hypothetical protein